METSNRITVRVLKYDGHEYRRWTAMLSRRESSLLVLDAEFDADVEHDLLGEIRRGTRTVEYYWLDRWYNIFQFLEEDGSTRLFYCNINLPPQFENGMLTYVDLDIDVLVQPEGSYQVLDLEEFEINANRYGYPLEVRNKANEALQQLISMIATRQFPFEPESVSREVSVP